MARMMIRRIRGRLCATRASFSGFACLGQLDELDANGVEHLLQQRLFLSREIALGLGFQHRQDVDDLLGLREVGGLARRALADRLAEAHQRRRPQGVDERQEVDGRDRLLLGRLSLFGGLGLRHALAGFLPRLASTAPTIPNNEAFLFGHRPTVSSTIYHTSPQRYNADLPMEDAHTGLTPEDAKQLRALRDGDEAAFASLVDRYHGPLLRLAMAYVPSHAVAEEVVQETWLGVLEGLSRFEGRSSLKTWIYRILINRAKTRGIRERRSVPFSPLGTSAEDTDEPAVDPARFRSTGYWVDHWAEPPGVWDDDTPEKLLLSKEGLAQIEKAIAALPPAQRQVITLRDVEGLSSAEVCNILAISETNQRVQLHRARSRVRRALARYLEGGGSQT